MIAALALWRQIHGVLRIALDSASDRSEPVERLLARATGITDPEARMERINEAAEQVLNAYERLVEQPAIDAAARVAKAPDPKA